jgi:circadian clock protein KaiA
LQSRLSICTLISSASLAQSLIQLLSSDRYDLKILTSVTQVNQFIEDYKESIDCLLVDREIELLPLFNKLYEQGTLLPIVIIEPETDPSRDSEEKPNLPRDFPTHLYHSGEVRIKETQLEEIGDSIDQAITQFLYLGPSCPIHPEQEPDQPNAIDNQQAFLILQQRRLAEKLKERLGYLGVYYKRNPEYFYRNLSQKDKKELITQINLEYRQIILNYFSDDEEINQLIDQMVNRAFFADMSVSQILEIHMELMDEFAQQLKLEGRREEILLDYRLALIDIIAHLCEMYRRSIPREDLPFELLFRID